MVNTHTQTYIFDSTPSANVSVSNNGGRFNVLLDKSIGVPEKAKNVKLRVIDSSIWNTVPSISPFIGNNTFNFIYNGTAYTTIINTGLYDDEDLNLYLKRDFVNKGLPANIITLSSNVSTQRIVFIFGADNVQIDFRGGAGLLRDMLGFNDRLVPTSPSTTGVSEEGDNVAKFNTIEYFLIGTSLINNGIPFNNTNTNIIAKHIISAMTGSKSSYLPYIPVWVDASELIRMSKNQLQFTLYDHLNNIVNTNSESFSFTLEIYYEME